MRGLRVIGDSKIFETPRSRCLGHSLKGFGAVRGCRMAMYNAPQIFIADQVRQRMPSGKQDLVPAFAKLRFDKLKI